MLRSTLLFSAALSLWACTAAAQDTLRWETDLATAQRLAAQTNRLVLVHFWGTTCGPCMEMERKVFTKSGLGTAIHPYYVPVKVQTDDPRNQQLVQQFEVGPIPCDVVMTAQGQIVGRSVGFKAADQYVGMLNQAAQQTLAQARPNGQLPANPAGAGATCAAASPYAVPPTMPASPYAVPSAASPYAATQAGSTSPYAPAAAAASPYAAAPYAAAAAATPAATANASVGQRYSTTYAPTGAPSGAAGLPSAVPGASAAASPTTVAGVSPGASSAGGGGAGDDRYGYYFQDRGTPANQPSPVAPASMAPPTKPLAAAPSSPSSLSATSSPAAAASDNRYAPPATMPGVSALSDNRYATDSRYGAPAAAAPSVTAAAAPTATLPAAMSPAVASPTAGALVNPAPAVSSATTAPVAPMAKPAALQTSASVATAPAAGAPPAATPSAIAPSMPTVALPPGSPPLALDGYCPVTVTEKMVWTKGDPRYGVVHRGHTYLFASAQEQQRFLAAPDAFSPIVSGNDPIEIVEQGRLVPGVRDHGMFCDGRMILFSSKANYEKFERDQKRYVAELQQALQNGKGLRR